MEDVTIFNANVTTFLWRMEYRALGCKIGTSNLKWLLCCRFVLALTPRSGVCSGTVLVTWLRWQVAVGLMLARLQCCRLARRALKMEWALLETVQFYAYSHSCVRNTWVSIAFPVPYCPLKPWKIIFPMCLYILWENRTPSCNWSAYAQL